MLLGKPAHADLKIAPLSEFECVPLQPLPLALALAFLDALIDASTHPPPQLPAAFAAFAACARAALPKTIEVDLLLYKQAPPPPSPGGGGGGNGAPLSSSAGSSLFALFLVPSPLPSSAAKGPAHGNVANAQKHAPVFCVFFLRHHRKTTHPTITLHGGVTAGLLSSVMDLCFCDDRGEGGWRLLVISPPSQERSRHCGERRARGSSHRARTLRSRRALRVGSPSGSLSLFT